MVFGETDRDRSGDRQKDQGGLLTLLGHVVNKNCLSREKMVGTATPFREYVASLQSLFQQTERFK